LENFIGFVWNILKNNLFAFDRIKKSEVKNRLTVEIVQNKPNFKEFRFCLKIWENISKIHLSN
jgi:hypothetical protein